MLGALSQRDHTVQRGIVNCGQHIVLLAGAAHGIDIVGGGGKLQFEHIVGCLKRLHRLALRPVEHIDAQRKAYLAFVTLRPSAAHAQLADRAIGLSRCFFVGSRQLVSIEHNFLTGRYAIKTEREQQTLPKRQLLH